MADKPGTVTDIAWSPNATSVDLAWTPPSDNGGSPIVAYEISVDGVFYASVTKPEMTVEGLTAGQDYDVTIVAKNETGPVGDGVTETVTAMGPPSVPRITAATQTGSSVVFSVEAPEDTGGGLTVVYHCVVIRGNRAPETVTDCGVAGDDVVIDRGDLKRGETLSLQVKASNELERRSDWSPAFTATIADVPARIQSVTGTQVDSDTWTFEITPPDDGGSPITGYRAEIYDFSGPDPLMVFVAGPKDPRVTVDLPVGKTVSISLVATNAIGKSLAHVPFSYITAFTDPSVPKLSRVIPGDGEIAVEWEEPDYSGGAPIESYSIEAVPEGSNELPTTVEVEGYERAAVVRGLVNGVKYKIVVTAYSQGGFASVESDAVSPSGMSEPPVVFVESVGDGFADVRIENPVNTGGLPVESYTVTTIPAGGTCTVVNQRCRVTGLTNGVGYVVAATLTTAGGTSRESLSWSFTPLSFLVPQLDMAALTPSQQPPTVSNPIAVVADVSGAGTPAAG
ncbi:MAG: hypothetical protein FGM42_10755, partial [Ilumatobacteraceae bacterium]|nr:hypothetical protein [Ilumatobacteraceae bacterium]